MYILMMLIENDLQDIVVFWPFGKYLEMHQRQSGVCVLHFHSANDSKSCESCPYLNYNPLNL